MDGFRRQVSLRFLPSCFLVVVILLLLLHCRDAFSEPTWLFFFSAGDQRARVLKRDIVAANIYVVLGT